MTITSVLHVAGLVTGLGLYGLLLSLALHRRAAGGGSAAGLTLATAMLGLMWNAGALLGGGADGGDLPRFAVALAYAALGLLPAVFIDTALASGHGSSRGARVSRAAAYALAATAAGLHLFAWQTGGDYLLKPVEPVRLAETLDRARRRLKRSGWRRDAMPRFEARPAFWLSRAGTWRGSPCAAAMTS